MKQFEIRENESGQRLDKYLKKLMSDAPASFIYKMLRKKNITLNGNKAAGSEIIAKGDLVKLFLSDETFDKMAPRKEHNFSVKNSVKTDLDVVFEDDNIIIVNKPAGILSQKAETKDISINEHIIAYLLETGQFSVDALQTFKPSICNRLDRNTSGLIMAGKSLKGLQYLSGELKKRSLKKFYRCLVKGVIDKPETMRGYLLKDERENMVSVFADSGTNRLYIETTYEPIEVIGEYTHLSVHLITGRSHQIRAHLASIGHPVIGDPKYGDEAANKLFNKYADIDRQLLHAYSVELSDGTKFEAGEPDDFLRAIEYMRTLAGGKGDSTKGNGNMVFKRPSRFNPGGAH